MMTTKAAIGILALLALAAVAAWIYREGGQGA